jgi:hypothetical protein
LSKWDKQWGKWEKGDKDKGKGKNKDKGHKLLNRAEDGNMICFSFNNKDHGCKGNCNMLHICRICQGDHPVFECPKRGKGKGKHQ